MMKMLLTAFLLGTSLQVLATAQIPDLMIYEGDTLAIFSNPLEAFLEERGSRKLPGFKGCSSTACWRGYLAIWELRNDSLFLKRITSCGQWDCKTKDAKLKKLFKNQYRNGEVFADWVNNEIIHPYGERLLYRHMGYESIYAFEQGFVFKDGALEKVKEYDNTQGKRSIYESKPDSLLRFFYDRINWDELPAIPAGRRKFVLTKITVNEDGTINTVELDRGINIVYDQEAIRLVKLIPSWRVNYRRGKFIPQQWYIPVSFDRSAYLKKLK